MGAGASTAAMVAMAEARASGVVAPVGSDASDADATERRLAERYNAMTASGLNDAEIIRALRGEAEAEAALRAVATMGLADAGNPRGAHTPPPTPALPGGNATPRGGGKSDSLRGAEDAMSLMMGGTQGSGAPLPTALPEADELERSNVASYVLPPLLLLLLLLRALLLPLLPYPALFTPAHHSTTTSTTIPTATTH